MSLINIYDLRETIRIEKKLLRVIGLYPKTTPQYEWLFFLTASINLFISFGQIITMLIQMVIARNDLSQLSDSLQYFMTLATFVCKLVNFIANKNKLLEIEHTLTSPLLNNFSGENFKLLQEKMKSCQNVAKIFRVFCVIAILLYSLTPFFDSNKSFPSPAWFPYNVTKYKYPTYVFQVVGHTNTAYANSTIDILTWMLISVASGQFEILKAKLRLIEYGKSDLKETEQSFKNCVRHHKEIIKLVAQIEDMFSKGIFIQFLASAIIICFVGFLLIIVPFGSLQFGFLVMYLLCMMCQVAMYCWYGHDVMTTSNTIGESFHYSNWYESHLSIRKSLIIFLEKTKKPVTLTAGGFITLSLATLTLILRSAYSYIAVLQRVYES